MESSKDKAMKRARKLLAVIENEATSEGEVFNASALLQRLLKEEGMTVADIEGSVAGAKVVEETVADLPKLDTWRAILAKAVAQAYRCEVYVLQYRDGFTATGRKRNRTRIVFMGYASDANLARSVYNVSCAAAENCWKAEAKRLTAEAWEMVYPDDPRAAACVRSRVTHRRKSFLIGFAYGIHRAYRANVRTDNELALATTIPSAVKSTFDSQVTGRKDLNSSCAKNKSFYRGADAGFSVGSGDRLCA